MIITSRKIKLESRDWSQIAAFEKFFQTVINFFIFWWFVAKILMSEVISTRMRKWEKSQLPTSGLNDHNFKKNGARKSQLVSDCSFWKVLSNGQKFFDISMIFGWDIDNRSKKSKTTTTHQTHQKYEGFFQKAHYRIFQNHTSMFSYTHDWPEPLKNLLYPQNPPGG